MLFFFVLIDITSKTYHEQSKGSPHFIRTSKFWVEAGCSLLFKDFQPQLFLSCS